jgi:hypothetical protein
MNDTYKKYLRCTLQYENVEETKPSSDLQTGENDLPPEVAAFLADIDREAAENVYIETTHRLLLPARIYPFYRDALDDPKQRSADLLHELLKQGAIHHDGKNGEEAYKETWFSVGDQVYTTLQHWRENVITDGLDGDMAEKHIVRETEDGPIQEIEGWSYEQGARSGSPHYVKIQMIEGKYEITQAKNTHLEELKPEEIAQIKFTLTEAGKLILK